MTTETSVRVPPHLREELERLASDEGVSVDELVTLAVAEKLSSLRARAFFAERAKRGDTQRFLEILNREGGEPPREGDEAP